AACAVAPKTRVAKIATSASSPPLVAVVPEPDMRPSWSVCARLWYPVAWRDRNRPIGLICVSTVRTRTAEPEDVHTARCAPDGAAAGAGRTGSRAARAGPRARSWGGGGVPAPHRLPVRGGDGPRPPGGGRGRAR